MDNQHQLIKGYRDLSVNEIELINEGKKLAEEVWAFIALLHKKENTDKRWVAIAQTDLQKGFMAAIRSIAKPTTF